MWLDLARTAALLLAAAFVAGTGVALARRGERALWPLGHLPSTLVLSFAGRYFAMAGMILLLLLAREVRALGLVLAVGAVMGLFDAVVVGRAGGPRLPHLVAAGTCGALALWCLAG
jgi:hypothetical protein